MHVDNNKECKKIENSIIGLISSHILADKEWRELIFNQSWKFLGMKSI